MDFEKSFLRSASKKQKAALQEIKRAAPKEWAEFKKLHRQQAASQSQRHDFAPPLFKITWLIVRKAPAAAEELQTLKSLPPGGSPGGKKITDEFLKAVPPLERKDMLSAKAAAPKLWTLFEAAMFEALNGGGLPAWVRLIAAKVIIERAAPKESDNLIKVNAKARESAEQKRKRDELAH